MKKIRVHIANDTKFMDPKVFVDINLPAIPRKGELIYLKNEQIRELEEKACEDIEDILFYYHPKWFYGYSCDCWTPKNSIIKDFDFGDANTVTDVLYDEDIIHIELDD